MALIDTVPRTRVTVPTFLAENGKNGNLPTDWLRTWDEDGRMFYPVSFAFQAVYLAAQGVGITVNHRRADSTGRYRTALRQWQMLHERYVPYPISGYRDTNWVKAHTYNGVYYPAQLWYLRPGQAMAAVPETSNHGLGLADDMASDVNNDNVPEYMNDILLMWLRDNGPDFGIGLETRSERWHWHWLGGNRLTQRTVNVLADAGVTIPDLSMFGFTYPAPTVAPPPPPPVPPPTDDPIPKATLQEGSTGPEVFKLIGVLKWNRWYPAEHMDDLNDSLFGGRTKTGVMNMQDVLRDEGLYPYSSDGIYGPKTEAGLRTHVANQNKPTTGPPEGWQPPPTVRPGDTGPLVQLIQNALIRDGYIADTPGNRDGVYGTATVDIVRQFQRDHNLEVDGIVGRMTWWYLINP